MRFFAWFDLKAAVIGAILMSSIVLWVNYDYGFPAAGVAALKQAAYTFCFAGLIVQFCRYLVLRPRDHRLALSLAVLLPTAVTTVLLYSVHSLKGTPEPELSTLPVVFISLVSFFMVGRRELAEAENGDGGGDGERGREPG